jgi:hypothetical protein
MNHLHHWLDSPEWALAFHRSLCHSSPLIPISPQFLMSRALTSWRTPSSHLNLGLPVFLHPHGLELKTFWTVLWGSIRTTCPHQRSLFILIHLTTSGSSDNWYNSLLHLLLHSPFSSTAPEMHLRILLSNEHRHLSSVFYEMNIVVIFCLRLVWHHILQSDVTLFSASLTSSKNLLPQLPVGSSHDSVPCGSGVLSHE